MSTHIEHAENPKAEALKYVATLVTLLILTAITVAASYINFGSGNVVIALTIATIKAIIVALISTSTMLPSRRTNEKPSRSSGISSRSNMDVH